MKMYWKLFARSIIRKVLMLLLIAVPLRPLVIRLSYVFQSPDPIGNSNWIIYLLDFFRTLSGDYIYIFILFLFLAYDYFREIPDAAALEIVKTSREERRHDCRQALVLWTLLFGYAVILCSLYVGGVMLSNSTMHALTPELVWYFVRHTAVYILLNGSIAIGFAWLISRCVGRLVGYICVILFAALFSPIALSQIRGFFIVNSHIYDWFQVCFIMPEGLTNLVPEVLYPVNWSIAARGFVWIGLIVLGLAGYYFARTGKRIRWAGIAAGICCSALSLWYAVLPVSYYSANDTTGERDPGYDQFRYVIRETPQQEKEAAFRIESYELTLKMGRQMQAEAVLHPDRKGLECYEMTLYHLYRIDSVTDETGEALAYERNGDYLTVYGRADGPEEIRIRYHGGGALFYGNRREMNLPGWFAYYPMAGFHRIYRSEEYQYEKNYAEEPARFHIEVDAAGTVYSDLERIEGNCFEGMTTGPTLLAGFYREAKLENGVTCVYPYLETALSPESNLFPENRMEAMEILEEEGLGREKILFCYGGAYGVPDVFEEDRVISATGWLVFVTHYEREGSLTERHEKTEEEKFEEAVTVVTESYRIMRGSEEEGIFVYQDFENTYLNQMEEFGYTETDMETFVLEYLGEDAWNDIIEWRKEDGN